VSVSFHTPSKNKGTKTIFFLSFFICHVALEFEYVLLEEWDCPSPRTFANSFIEGEEIAIGPTIHFEMTLYQLSFLFIKEVSPVMGIFSAIFKPLTFTVVSR